MDTVATRRIVRTTMEGDGSTFSQIFWLRIFQMHQRIANWLVSWGWSCSRRLKMRSLKLSVVSNLSWMTSQSFASIHICLAFSHVLKEAIHFHKCINKKKHWGLQFTLFERSLFLVGGQPLRDFHMKCFSLWGMFKFQIEEQFPFAFKCSVSNMASMM